MHLLRYVVKCTVTDSPLNTQTSCSKCPSSVWIPFLTCVTRELVNLQNTAALLMLLATGNSFISLHYEYLLDATTVHEIVRYTCDVMWECVIPAYISARDRNDWLLTADEFYEKTSFPNCI